MLKQVSAEVHAMREHQAAMIALLAAQLKMQACQGGVNCTTPADQVGPQQQLPQQLQPQQACQGTASCAPTAPADQVHHQPRQHQQGCQGGGTCNPTAGDQTQQQQQQACRGGGTCIPTAAGQVYYQQQQQPQQSKSKAEAARRKRQTAIEAKRARAPSAAQQAGHGLHQLHLNQPGPSTAHSQDLGASLPPDSQQVGHDPQQLHLNQPGPSTAHSQDLSALLPPVGHQAAQPNVTAQPTSEPLSQVPALLTSNPAPHQLLPGHDATGFNPAAAAAAAQQLKDAMPDQWDGWQGTYRDLSGQTSSTMTEFT